MFRRSCTSVFRQCVKSSPKPTISRTMFFQRIYCSGSETSKPSDPIDGSSKRVTLFFKTPDGHILEEVGFVNERVYDVINRVDHERVRYPGYGICKGVTSCSTCHMTVEEKDFEKLTPPDNDEIDVIGLAPGNTEFSRLGCKVRVTEEMEGVVFQLPSFTDIPENGK